MKIKIKFRRTTYEDEASSSSSSEMVASIDDLLTCILLRLPMKSLIRFKLVCKHWHSLITDPHFCGLRNPNPNPAAGLFLHSPNSTPIDYIPFQSPTQPLDFTIDASASRFGIVHSCNGLLLCCTNFHSRNRKYYVYNPTTIRFSTLPKLGCALTNIRGISLAFDPAKSPHYKVVCVSGVGGPYQIELYSSERGPWRKWGQPLPHANIIDISFNNGVYWNGAIHWLSYDTRDSLCFNVENEIARDFPSPPIQGGLNYRSSYYLGESCDRLNYTEMRNSQLELEVYEMKRDYSEWFVKYKVDLTSVVALHPEMLGNGLNPGDWDCYAYSVFGLVHSGGREEPFLVLHIPGRVLRYHLLSRTFLTIREFQDSETQVLEGYLRYFGTNCSQHIYTLSCV